MVPFGGVIGGILMALLMDRIGATKVMPVLCLVACIALVLTGIQLGKGSMALAMIMVFLVGFTLTGALNNLSILAATYYPTEARATGVSWALGAGRIGSIIGSMLGAWLFVAAGGVQWLFFWIAVPVLFASLALLLMGMRPRQGAAGVALPD